MQVILYYRIYPKDRVRLKSMVALIWVLDLLHTCMACAALWFYLIDHFGDEGVSDYITWSVGFTVALTAFVSFFVHCFFSHRIFTLSRGKWLLTMPIATLAMFRLACALVTTAKMIQLKMYSLFVQHFAWIFTMGLALSAAVDVLIALALCWYLNKSRTGFSSMDTIIDSITLYTIESGMATCVMTIVSLICWLSMPHNLIFLGLHFAISKLYANAFMATYASNDTSEHAMPVLFPSRAHGFTSRHEVDPISTKVQISVEKTIHREMEAVDEPSEYSGGASERSRNEQEDDSIKLSRV
ncbi:hypothetical protein K474DRAFT_1707336 [Panus rudis PR-1116 ss-1]|nr:hypothetical protein K474DRAFT_1707336 [Panus rudis PR-1116 ss-1]